jgi:hypothetical protein
MENPFKGIFGRKPKMEAPIATSKEDPFSVIEIGNNREALALKLEEYRTRLDLSKKPETQFDEIYKIAIIERLLADGKVDPAVLFEELKREYDGFSARGTFFNACGVIRGYVEDGGKNVRGGTGFPDSKKEKIN